MASIFTFETSGMIYYIMYEIFLLFCELYGKEGL